MRIIEVENYEKMSQLAAGMLGAQVLLKPDCVLGLATGSSPIRTYELLAEQCAAGLLDFSQVRTVNLDEYCGLKPDDPQRLSTEIIRTVPDQFFCQSLSHSIIIRLAHRKSFPTLLGSC